MVLFQMEALLYAQTAQLDVTTAMELCVSIVLQTFSSMAQVVSHVQMVSFQL